MPDLIHKIELTSLELRVLSDVLDAFRPAPSAPGQERRALAAVQSRLDNALRRERAAAGLARKAAAGGRRVGR